MKIWKPITQYLKPRNELGYHTDLGLEEGECLMDYKKLVEVFNIRTLEGKVRKIHLEICDEVFNGDGLTKD